MSTSSLPICSLPGDQDLYGVGVRVGLYLQWISTLLTTLLEPADEDLLRVINLLIQSAIFMGLVLLISRKEIQALDPVISIWLLFGALSSLTGSGMNPLGRLSGLYRILLYTCVAGYACWFWVTGLDHLLQNAFEENGGPCTVVAFFRGVDISGPFRNYNRLASGLGVVLCIGFLFAWLRQKRSSSRNRSPKSRRPQVAVEYFLLSTGIIVLSIVAIEYLLKVNQVTGIDTPSSVGQLIPLLVGSFSFAETMFDVFSEKMWKRKRCWILFRTHLT
jgi:hypothetical protein